MKILDYIKEQKIYGIIREDNVNHALELTRAYIEGGIKVLELNCPIEVLDELSKTDIIDRALFAQGGIITSAQAHCALQKGAKIISSPILQNNLIRLSYVTQSFLIPSVTTANEAYNAWKARIPLIKVYPVNNMGGVEYIKELKKPMPFLNLLPCGFVKIDDIEGYLKAGADAVGVGREFYLNNYSEIVKKVKEVRKMVGAA